MSRFRLHYNEHCGDCRRLAEMNCRLDWLSRFDRTTQPSPLGIPELGEVHVVDNKSGTIYTGAYATLIICQNVPAFWVAALLMRIPFVFERMARQKPGCNGERCTIGSPAR